MNLELAIFDLDDTLVDTSHVYWRARDMFACAMAERGAVYAEVVEVFERIDGENIGKLGHIPERYGKSMAETLDYFVESGGMKLSEELALAISDAARHVPATIPDLIPGAHALLSWARSNYTTALLTRGVTSLQSRKIAHHGLEKYFDYIKIVETKSSTDFAAVMSRLETTARHTWVIGDSIKSDINPALEVGARAVLFHYAHPEYIWQQEYGVQAKGGFYVASTLAEIPNIMRRPHDFKLEYELAA